MASQKELKILISISNSRSWFTQEQISLNRKSHYTCIVSQHHPLPWRGVRRTGWLPITLITLPFSLRTFAPPSRFLRNNNVCRRQTNPIPPNAKHPVYLSINGVFVIRLAATYSPTKRSTIGAVRFNFSVRNGKRWNPDAITA